ncbi:MAG TPA: hypothetical protein VNL94_04445, partial [Candidatus Binatia bacterium]|nr:hypothetical protein [Candidatus Binatia bacterium]
PDRRPEPQPERAPAPGFFAGLATLLRPLGATLATFGLVGLLVGTVSLDPMGGAASAPGEDVGAGWPAPQATSAAEYQPGTSFDTGVVVTPLATDAVGRSNDDSAPLVATSALPSTSLILAGSALAVALGIGLFIAGSRAIRRQDGSRGG